MNVDFQYMPLCIAVYFNLSVPDYALIPPPHTYDLETVVVVFLFAVVVFVVVDVVISVSVVFAVVAPIVVVVVLPIVVVFATVTFAVVATLAVVVFVVVAAVAVLAAELVQRTCLRLLVYICPGSTYSTSLEFFRYYHTINH